MFKQICILISSMLLLGCYASSTNTGVVKEHRQETTQKEEVVMCCFVIRDLDTGLKDYDCEDMSFLECRALKARPDGD